jgi:hypothetical protein
MGSYGEIIERFRRLPTPLLYTHVASRFVFGFGLGATLAASRRSSWRMAGWITMILGALLALPGGITVLRQR